MLKIYCDLDGVLVDLERGTEQLAGMNIADTVTKEEEQELWNKILNIKDFWTLLPAMEDKDQLWNFIARYKPIILSAPPKTGIEKAIKEKTKWCENNLQGYEEIIIERDKAQYARTESGEQCILIDDMDHNIVKWLRAGGVAIKHTSAEDTIRQLKVHLNLELTQKMDMMYEQSLLGSDLSSPKKLLKWVNNNIEYGWMDGNFKKHHGDKEFDTQYFSDNYKLALPKEVFKHRMGTCWDQTIFNHWVFKELLNYKEDELKMCAFQQYYGKHHTFLSFKKEDGWYVFETAYENIKGIHGPFNSLEQIGEESYIVVENQAPVGKGYKMNIMNPHDFKRKLTAKEFLDACKYDYAKSGWDQVKKHLAENSIVLEYLVPTSMSLNKWLIYRKKHKITAKQYHNKHPKAKWKVVHSNPKQRGTIVKGMGDMTYEKAKKAHAAIMISKSKGKKLITEGGNIMNEQYGGQGRGMNFKKNAPTFAYEAVYGELPNPPLYGMINHPSKPCKLPNGIIIQIDKEIDCQLIVDLNNINKIETRSSCGGHGPNRVTFIIFRMSPELDNMAIDVSQKLNDINGLYSICEIGQQGRPRIVVAGKTWIGQPNWNAWWQLAVRSIKTVIQKKTETHMNTIIYETVEPGREHLPFRQTVDVFIFIKDKIVAQRIERESYPDQYWVRFPGGGLDGSLLDEAAKKEALEEAGAVVNNLRPIAQIKMIWPTEWVGDNSKRAKRYKQFQGDQRTIIVANLVKFVQPTSTEGDGWQGDKLVSVTEAIDILSKDKQMPEFKKYKETQLHILKSYWTQYNRTGPENLMLPPYNIDAMFESYMGEQNYFKVDREIHKVQFGDHIIDVQILKTNDEHCRGLQYSHELGENEGALFLYEGCKQPTFHMRNVFMDLDVIFVDGNSRVMEIIEMKSESEDYYTPREPTFIALEMPAGWAKDRGITEGVYAPITPMEPALFKRHGKDMWPATYIQETILKRRPNSCKIFFLPIKTRPKEYKPLSSRFKGKFWHCGIIHGKQVYETFNNGRYQISPIETRVPELEKQKVIYIRAVINKTSLKNEIFSGTDCAEYVARVIGLSKLRGPGKGKHYPEDVYNEIKKGPINESDDKKRQYDVLMLLTVMSQWDAITGSIDRNDIRFDDGYGIEDEPHITVIYGLDKVDPELVRKRIEEIDEPLKYTITGIDVFNKKEHDVLHFTIESEDLSNLHDELKKTFNNVQRYPTYEPHMTIAYLKPGRGTQYKKVFGEEDRHEFQSKTFEYGLGSGDSFLIDSDLSEMSAAGLGSYESPVGKISEKKTSPDNDENIMAFESFISDGQLKVAVNKIPKDLYDALFKDKTDNGRTKIRSIKDIGKRHNEIIDNIKKWSHTDNIDKDVLRRKLIGIFSVPNGDYIFYSHLDKKVYLWSHDSNKIKRSQSYKKFLEKMKTGDHYTTFYSIINEQSELNVDDYTEQLKTELHKVLSSNFDSRIETLKFDVFFEGNIILFFLNAEGNEIHKGRPGYYAHATGLLNDFKGGTVDTNEDMKRYADWFSGVWDQVGIDIKQNAYILKHDIGSAYDLKSKKWIILK